MLKSFATVITAALLATTLLGGQANAACFKAFANVNGDTEINVLDVSCAALVGLWHFYGGESEPMPDCTLQPALADADCSGGCGDFTVVPQGTAIKPVTVNDIKILIVKSLQLKLPKFLDGDGDGCPDACDPAVYTCTWAEPADPVVQPDFPEIDAAKANGLGTAQGTSPESYGFDGLYGLFAGFAQDVAQLATANSEVSASAPACATTSDAGRLWYDTAEQELLICDGAEWK